MRIIYVDERTSQGRALASQLNRSRQQPTINPFPWSLLELALYGMFSLLDRTLRVLVNAVAAILRRIFIGK